MYPNQEMPQLQAPRFRNAAALCLNKRLPLPDWSGLMQLMTL
jgi:hypothetical protein